MRLVNTPFFVLLDTGSGLYYLWGGTNWLSTKDLAGAWEESQTIPPAVVGAAADAVNRGELEPPPENADSAAKKPRIILVTEPTTLISTDGDPAYTPIAGTELLYVSNTESDVFLDIGTQRIFLLISGRWYVTSSLQQGPWKFVPSGLLPQDFERVPVGSPKAHVLAHVAGTQQAKEAVLDTYIPQTAAIEREGTTLEVSYDGTAAFERVAGTNMAYAKNTPFSVIRVQEGNVYEYYCCEDAVWFRAESPYGPWSVSTAVPAVI